MAWTCSVCGYTDLFDAPATTAEGEDACLECGSEAGSISAGE